jgi:quercetin dioxygenase-like cupin family protein
LSDGRPRRAADRHARFNSPKVTGPAKERESMPVRKISDIPLEEVKAGKGTRRQILIDAKEAPNFALRRFVMDPGGGIPNHTNTVEHEQYVLGGRAKIGIGERVHEVGKGDVVYIPAEVPHWYEVVGDEPFEFLCAVPNLPDHVELLDKDE